ncbi:transposase [Morganella morganii]|nr:transposase [Morganella morganii]MCU6233538.1 transposase [Morganella morganii]QWL91626.1 transposase [Morganella morganii subsp. morganii]HED1572152.1 transposase [Morganella morganii]
MSGKRYLEEFKIESVKQVVDRGHSVSGVATRLGMVIPPFLTEVITHTLYILHWGVAI